MQKGYWVMVRKPDTDLERDYGSDYSHEDVIDNGEYERLMDIEYEEHFLKEDTKRIEEIQGYLFDIGLSYKQVQKLFEEAFENGEVSKKFGDYIIEINRE